MHRSAQTRGLCVVRAEIKSFIGVLTRGPFAQDPIKDAFGGGIEMCWVFFNPLSD